MATAEATARPHGKRCLSLCFKHSKPSSSDKDIHSIPTNENTADRQNRRRPFASWVKRLTKKNSSDNTATSGKKGIHGSPSKTKKYGSLKNNPYPESGHLHRPSIASSGNGQLSLTPTSNVRNSFATEDVNSEERKLPASNRSAAPTVATNTGTINSDAGQSKAGTSNTVGGGMSSNEGAGNSTFSSPNHSERSLTTTLTTIQSTAPSQLLNGQNGAAAGPAAQAHPPHTPTVQFSHQFPTSPPPSAIPSHLAPQGNPTTYNTATANGILTDNASILTLASSSKRRRRHSLDTDASVRALAPSSVWGGSRESLPLSVLSANVDASQGGLYESQSRPRPTVGGFASAERASVYSSSGTAGPVLSSERNSYYASKQGHDAASVRSGKLGHTGGGDGASMRSGLPGHGRNDSITGSIGGVGGGAASGNHASPLASPKEPFAPKSALNRRSSEWKADTEGLSDGEEEHVHAGATGVADGSGVEVEAGAEEPVGNQALDAAKGKDKVLADGETGVAEDHYAEDESKDVEKSKENEKPV
ncbi:MAG: hypothetical protein M1820_004893 [Bogoriella megaspora]|nr:MAG: hypothetical protein M1820_004893 [Bogoriella megaspora]